MKVLALGLLGLLSLNCQAGSLQVYEGTSNVALGGAVKSYSLENTDGSSPDLYVQNDKGQSCRISVATLKALNVDPVSLGERLKNSNAIDGPILKCYVPADQPAATRTASKIEIQSSL